MNLSLHLNREVKYPNIFSYNVYNRSVFQIWNVIYIFFLNSTVYLCNQFTRELIKNGKVNLTIFRVKFANDDILLKLMDLISKF